VPYIAGKAGVSVIENNDAQTHPIAGVVLASFDVVDSQIPVAVMHASIPFLIIVAS